MAEIITELEDEVGEIEAVEQQQEVQQQPEPAVAEPESELPEKYRGKSASDIARMHHEAEKLIARQSQEVGEIRKLADELIKSQLVKKPEVDEPKEIDFFENPQEAIRRAVESNPKVQAAEQYAMHVQRQMAQQQLVSKHPDMPAVVADPEFQQWVAASKVRTQLFKAADSYDVDAADELLSTFKELRGRRAPAAPEVRADRDAIKQSLRHVAVDTGGSGETGKKTYRRADLINLRIRDPNKYESMQEEISAAYREGRVK